MDVFDPGNELVGQEQDSLQGEFAVAEVEKILQARSEEVQNHGVVVTFGTKPADEGDADTSGKGLVDTSLIFELRVFGLDAFELNGNFFAGDDVSAWSRR